MSKNKKNNKTRRTGSATGFPPPMPPDVAAQYFSQMASAAKANKSSSISDDNKSNGKTPSPPPPSGSSSVSFGSLDIAALAQSGDFSAAAAAAAASRGRGGSFSNSAGGPPPCSEAEVKALMGMFAEIMGMSMEEAMEAGAAASSTGNKSSGTKSSVFSFGGKDASDSKSQWSEAGFQRGIAAAAQAAGLVGEGGSWGSFDYYDDEDDDDEEDFCDDYDEDDYDDSDDEDRKLPAPRKKSDQEQASRGVIDPHEWESLEQVARDDALEAEEKARKAAKKREKKQRKKERLRKEAAEKAAEAARVKRDKLVQSWRSRIISACQSNDVTKLDALIGESPLRREKQQHQLGEMEDFDAFVESQMKFLVLSCVAKSRDEVGKDDEARQKLTDYVLKSCPSSVFMIGKGGLSTLQTACKYGDFCFVQSVVTRAKEAKPGDVPVACLDGTCEDSGWTALHYAVICGSEDTMEMLLEGGCDVTMKSNDLLTSHASSGDGVTAQELAEVVLLGNYEDSLEYNGTALDGMLPNGAEHRNYHRVLRDIISRLSDVETNGYSPPADTTVSRRLVAAEPEPAKKGAETSKRKKKKKKAQQAEVTKKPTPVPQPAAAPPAEDPMITALIGMGFSREQIDAAVKACGGTNRATADDLVMWILEQQSGGSNDEPPMSESLDGSSEKSHDEEATGQSAKKALVAKKRMDEANAAQKAEEAKLKARRRNREWNQREKNRQQAETQMKLARAVQLRAKADAMKVAGTAYPATSYAGEQSMNPSAPVASTVPQSVLQPPSRKDVQSAAKKGHSKAKGEAATTSQFDNGIPKTIGLSQPKSSAVPKLGGGGKTAGGKKSKKQPAIQILRRDAPLQGPAKGTSGQSNSNGVAVTSVPPPGFKVPSATTEEGSMSTENLNSNGEFRATARAFVPRSFTPPPPADPAVADQSSAKFRTTTQAKVPPGTVPPSVGVQTSTVQSSSANVDPLTMMLSNGFPAPTEPRHLSLFERTESAPSAGSSVSGLSLSDGAALSSGMGFGIDANKNLESNQPLFDPIAIATAPSTGVFGVAPSTAMAPNSSLWGGGSDGKAAATSSLTGILPGFSEDVEKEDKQKNLIGGHWTGANKAAATGNSNGLGSIW